MTVKPASIPLQQRLLCNKAELAEAFGKSVVSVDHWLRRGCPYVQRGERGRAWVFNIIDVAEWRFGAKGPEQQDQDPDSLAPKDRLYWYQGNREKRKDALDAGELYERGPTLQAISTTLAVLVEQIRAIPDLLERRAGATPEQAERAADEIDTQLEVAKQTLLAKLAKLAGGRDTEEVA
ncbi:DUF1441 family protein [Thiorhodococcus fuscus]|uniref:DUF1441 family protein n=1 Tax=Thiorhodococcus fuscus TaxID=527200 RepID=A0ABW4Y8M3_9GAMM